MIQKRKKTGKTGTPTHPLPRQPPPHLAGTPHTRATPGRYRPGTCHHPSSHPTPPTHRHGPHPTRSGTGRTGCVRVRGTTHARLPTGPGPPRADPPPLPTLTPRHTSDYLARRADRRVRPAATHAPPERHRQEASGPRRGMRSARRGRSGGDVRRSRTPRILGTMRDPRDSR